MSNPYIVSTQGPAGSKMPPSKDDNAKDDMIKQLTSIIHEMKSENLKLQSENLKLQKKYKAGRQEVQVYKQVWDDYRTNLLQIETNEVSKLKHVQMISKQTDVPELLTDYLQVWGFTEDESKHFAKEMSIEQTDYFKRSLLPEDWKLEGDITRIDGLSDLQKEYLKWLWDNLNGNESKLNVDIIKEICSKWRKQVQKTYYSNYEISKHYNNKMVFNINYLRDLHEREQVI